MTRIVLLEKKMELKTLSIYRVVPKKQSIEWRSVELNMQCNIYFLCMHNKYTIYIISFEKLSSANCSTLP